MAEHLDRLLLLVRHGETVASSSVRLIGAGDVALSRLGRRQARRVCDALRHVPLRHAATSALARARATAEIILEGRSVSVQTFSELNEVSFGRWEGLTLDEVCRRDPHLQAAWRSGDPDFVYPGGESRRGFRDRVLRGWRFVLEGWRRRLCLEAHHRGGSPGTLPGPGASPGRGGGLLVVAHKGVLRTILGDLAGREGPYPNALELGSISRVRLGVDGRPTIVSTNEVDHLREDRVPGS